MLPNDFLSVRLSTCVKIMIFRFLKKLRKIKPYGIGAEDVMTTDIFIENKLILRTISSFELEILFT